MNTGTGSLPARFSRGSSLGTQAINLRTTLNINDALLEELKARAAHERRSFREVLEGTLAHLFDLMETCSAGGNLSTDAVISAQALEHAGVVHSNDRDCGRFDGVRWVNPLMDGSGAC